MTPRRRQSSELLAGAEEIQVGAAFSGEIILFAQAAINAAGNLRRSRTDNLAGAAAQQNGKSNFGMRFVGVGNEPAHARSGIAASAGFAQRHFVAAGIEAALAGAVQNSGEHTFANFR